jgi:hypothetical protein
MVYNRDFLLTQVGGLDRHRPPPALQMTDEERRTADEHAMRIFVDTHMNRLLYLLNDAPETRRQRAEMRRIIQAMMNRFGTNMDENIEEIIDDAEDYLRRFRNN